MSPASHLEILPLGGLGEFGMNTMLMRYGDDGIVIDAGMMFPGADFPGVDAIVPSLGPLHDVGTLHGVLLTHGHEDHIGGLPRLLDHFDTPVFGPPHALELARRRLLEYRPEAVSALRELPADGEPLELGPFVISALPTAHSIPQAKMFVIRTPVGTILHTGDFKLNPAAPHPGGTDLEQLRKLGDTGVLALLSDSTNALEPGETPGESAVAAGIDELMATARERVWVTCFASNVDRVSTIATSARKHGRRIAVVGSALEANVEVADRLGILRLPPGLRESAKRLMGGKRNRAVLLATGSQGEPGSAMRRIAMGSHPDAYLEEGDLLIHSARIIPGNERTIGRMLDGAIQQGVSVVTRREAPVHVSGHPARGELAKLIDLVRPRFLVPVHGEYRQLDAHARLARERGLERSRIGVIRSGDLLAIREDSIEVVDRFEMDPICLDPGRRTVDPALIRERRRISREGIVIPVVTLDGASGKIAGTRVVTRGFADDDTGDERREIEELLVRTVSAATASGPVAPDALEDRIRADLRRHLRRRMGRRPLVLPLIVEPSTT